MCGRPGNVTSALLLNVPVSVHIQLCSAACCVSCRSGDATDGLTCGLLLSA